MTTQDQYRAMAQAAFDRPMKFNKEAVRKYGKGHQEAIDTAKERCADEPFPPYPGEPI